MSKGKSAPIMKDAAQEGGVAIGTVSKVINGVPVGKEYRIRVEKVVKKLNYRPKLQAPESLPMVSIDQRLSPQIPCVFSDNRGGGRLAVEKLIENGCRRLASFRAGTSLVSELNKQKDGFVSACEEYGIPYDYVLVGEGIAIHEERAFEYYLAGASLGKIVDMLFTKGIASPTGNTKWSRAAVDKLLANKKYISIVGVVVHYL